MVTQMDITSDSGTDSCYQLWWNRRLLPMMVVHVATISDGATGIYFQQ